MLAIARRVRLIIRKQIEVSCIPSAELLVELKIKETQREEKNNSSKGNNPIEKGKKCLLVKQMLRPEQRNWN